MTVNDFIENVKSSPSMRQAAKTLGIEYKKFIKIAKTLGIYRPNRGLRGFSRGTFLTYNALKAKNTLISSGSLKNVLLREGLIEYKCNRCGISSWNGKSLALELHHIDGNHWNIDISNIELLCPNCHSQTSNFTSKNGNGGWKKDIIEADVIDALKKACSLGNAMAIYNECHDIKLPGTSTVYRLFSKVCKDNNIMFERSICKDITADISGEPEIFVSKDTKKSDSIKNKKQNQKNTQIKHRAKILYIIRQLRLSDIDFHSFGWASKAAKIIGISPQKASNWMKRNMPKFYAENCYKRGIDLAPGKVKRSKQLKGEKRKRFERILMIHKIRTSGIDFSAPDYKQKFLEFYGNANGLRWMLLHMPKFCKEHNIKR